MTPDWVVQVCDSRISYTAKPPFDSARKILFYEAHGAQLSLVFTGIATIHEPGLPVRPTEIWLADVAPEIAAKARSVPEFAVSLMRALDSAIAATRHALPTADCRISIVMAGFVIPASPPGAICLSNFQVGGYRLPLLPGSDPIPVPVQTGIVESHGSFNCSVVTKESGIGLLLHGDHSVLRPPFSAELQLALQGAAEANDPIAVRQALVETLGRVATANPTGTVSADCWSRVVWRDGHPELFESHFCDLTKQSLNPTIIGDGIRLESVLVSQEPTPAHLAARARLEAGQLGQKFDTATLTEYLNWSPRIQAAAAAVEQLGVTVTPPSYVADLLTLIKLSGYQYVTTLERHIASAGSWADEMAKDVIATSIEQSRGLFHIVGHTGGETRNTVSREYLLELLLIALNPDKYPSQRPLGAFSWGVNDEIKAAAKRFNPRFATDQ